MSYPSPVWNGDRYGDPEWREATPFEATLTFRRFERGRSAAHAVWTDEEGHHFPMFLVDLAELIGSKLVQSGGKVHGVWVFRKRGQNFGIGVGK